MSDPRHHVKCRCIAVIDQKNEPVCIVMQKKEENEYDLQFLVHASIDAVMERIKEGPKQFFLGLLSSIDDAKIWGWVTASQYKIILVTDNNPRIKTGDINSILSRAHIEFVDACCNPFFDERHPEALMERLFACISSVPQ
eukprot:gnl/Dysnectes_brevis/3094_a3848_1480.p1 GENE.gnl/Dysnectes_brevis/3094_a3848_1480~~gnl/Dysnectes_brevis/3094_a3848_1480.p1  ORF type:complete len:152 (+),score=3.10 gnl/Dysnectes_brevis/3094_a3848_1480:39-458(+)